MSDTQTTATAAATTAAAPSTTTAVVPGASTSTISTASSADWTTGLSDELKGYVQTKGFKDPSAVVDSYRGLEKTIGVPQDRILKLPENMDSPEGRAIWERLGAPKEAKEYKIEIPKEAGDQKLADGLRDVAYKNGFSHRQVENLVNWWNESQTAATKSLTEAHQHKMTQENDSLKKEWGQAYDQNKEIANQAARKLGMDPQVVLAMGELLGPAKAMKALHDLGIKTGEHQFVVGGRQPGGQVMDPNSAKAKLASLRSDEGFIKRFTSGDADAVREWNRTNEQAFGAPAQ